MSKANLGQSAMTVVLVSIGVIGAGFLMAKLRGTFPFLNVASNGFDT